MSGPLVLLIVACVLAAVTRGRLLISGDGRSFYLPLSDAFLHHDFSALLTTRQANFTVALFALVLAAVRAVLPHHWQLAMLALNVACSAVAGTLLVRLVYRVSGSRLATAAALVLYLTCYDIFRWTSYLLTDCLFLLLSTLAFSLVVGRLTGEPSRHSGVRLALTVVAAVFARVVGVTVVTATALIELFAPARRKMLWFVFTAGVAIAVLAHAWFYQDMNRWPTSVMRPKLLEYSERERTGEVVYDRRESAHAPPAAIRDFLGIEADRFVRFFQFTAPSYSKMHNAISTAYYVPLYILALAGLAAAMRDPDPRRRSIGDAALLWILAADALSTVTVLDWDWRYRMPVMMQLIFFACWGVDRIAKQVAAAREQQRGEVSSPQTAGAP